MGWRRRRALCLPHLTAEQVADALAFYLEHQDEIERYIQEQADDAEPEV